MTFTYEQFVEEVNKKQLTTCVEFNHVIVFGGANTTRDGFKQVIVRPADNVYTTFHMNELNVHTTYDAAGQKIAMGTDREDDTGWIRLDDATTKEVDSLTKGYGQMDQLFADLAKFLDTVPRPADSTYFSYTDKQATQLPVFLEWWVEADEKTLFVLYNNNTLSMAISTPRVGGMSEAYSMNFSIPSKLDLLTPDNVQNSSACAKIIKLLNKYAP